MQRLSTTEIQNRILNIMLSCILLSCGLFCVHFPEYLNESGGSEQTLSSLGEIFTAALSHQPCVIVLDGLDDLGKSCVNPSQQVGTMAGADSAFK